MLHFHRPPRSCEVGWTAGAGSFFLLLLSQSSKVNKTKTAQNGRYVGQPSIFKCNRWKMTTEFFINKSQHPLWATAARYRWFLMLIVIEKSCFFIHCVVTRDNRNKPDWEANPVNSKWWGICGTNCTKAKFKNYLLFFSTAVSLILLIPSFVQLLGASCHKAHQNLPFFYHEYEKMKMNCSITSGTVSIPRPNSYRFLWCVSSGSSSRNTIKLSVWVQISMNE